jgi:hypothetical protein
LVADEGTSVVGLLNDPQRSTQIPEVPVVDATVVELVGELGEQVHPVPARRGSRYANLDRSLDDAHRSES